MNKTLDDLLNALRQANLPLYVQVSTPAIQAYCTARDDYVKRYPMPNFGAYGNADAYRIAMNSWRRDLADYQVSAFMKVVSGA